MFEESITSNTESISLAQVLSFLEKPLKRRKVTSGKSKSGAD